MMTEAIRYSAGIVKKTSRFYSGFLTDKSHIINIGKAKELTAAAFNASKSREFSHKKFMQEEKSIGFD